MTTRTDFLISGGGIGGLALALALARKGRTVRLLEQAASFRDPGTGVLLSPNGTRMLERLGLGARIRLDAYEPESTVVRDALSGEDLYAGPPSAAVGARYGAQYLATLRGDLLSALLDACREHSGIDIRNGHGIVDFGEAQPGAYVYSEEGERFEAGALIGAGGTWSPMRSRLVGDGDPRVSGYIACRALMPRDEVPEDCWSSSVVVWAGPHTHVAQYPVSRGEMLNVVAVFRSHRYEPG